MLSYLQAEQLAEMLLDLQFGGKAVLLKDQTVSLPYGWVFYYQGRRWVETRSNGDKIIGGGPILVDRFKADIRNITGAGTILQDWLADYEKSLHPNDLKATPQRPASREAVQHDAE